MLDEIAIQQLLNRFTEAASRGDLDKVMLTFMPDGIWEVAAFGAKFQGITAIREAMQKFAEPMEYIIQINAPGVIDVNGDHATVRSVIREEGKISGRNEVFEAVGFYADTLFRTPEGWKFTHRAFELRGMHKFALLAEAG